MKPLRIALAQMAPSLGALSDNIARHREILAAEVAMREDDARLLALAAETTGMSAVVSFVEESSDHRLFISAALMEDGEVRFVHRKLFLPTYGLFDERRFFAAGDRLR